MGLVLLLSEFLLKGLLLMAVLLVVLSEEEEEEEKEVVSVVSWVENLSLVSVVLLVKVVTFLSLG
jgi:hypothetical protein